MTGRAERGPTNPAMAKKKKPNLIHRWRRASQFLFVFALNPVFYQNLGVCFPAMNCWACPAVAFGCPIGAIGQFLFRGLIPFAAIGLMILAGALIGRMICGWVCPFGLLQDLMNRIPSGKKFRLPKAVAYLKYPIFLVTVIWIPLQFGVMRTASHVAGSDFFFCNYCPAGALEAAVPYQLGWIRGSDEGAAVVADAGEAEAAPDDEPGGGMQFGDESTGFPDNWGDEGDGAESGDANPEGPPTAAAAAAGGKSKLEFFLGTPQMWVLYVFLALFVFFRRPFCRGICPIGMVFALLTKFSLVRMRVNKELCKDCDLCEKGCPVENKIPLSPANQDCVRCLECLKNCRHSATQVGLVSVKAREDYWE